MTEQTPLTRAEMLGIAQQLDILKEFGSKRCRMLRVNYTPGLPYKITYGDEAPPEPIKTPPTYELTYILDDAMFGGEVFAAVTCNGLVVIRPFLWPGYEALLKMRITAD